MVICLHEARTVETSPDDWNHDKIQINFQVFSDLDMQKKNTKKEKPINTMSKILKYYLHLLSIVFSAIRICRECRGTIFYLI